LIIKYVRGSDFMDAIYNFAKNFVNVKYEDIPSPAVEATKKEFIDSLGVALAGSSKTGVKELLDLVKDWGGKQQSTIISYGIKVPTPNAAQVNATMTHALDYDDAHDGAQMHPGVIGVPTALAVAEQVGRVSGKEFITAVALGTDFICRLGLAAHPGTSSQTAGWHPTTLYGFLGAAAIAGRLLGLDEDRMVNALGIAYHQCSGNGQCVLDGALTKRMGPGFAVRGGITAALMAEKGITGAKNCLEGEFGIYKLYHQGDYDADALVKDLGRRFEGINVSLKPYPCCRGTHTSIDAALALVNDYDIKAVDIEQITVFTGEGNYQILCSPLQLKLNPRNAVDCQFNIPWAVATAIAKRKVSVGDFTEEAIKIREVFEVLQKIDVELDCNMSRANALEPVRINIRVKGGEIYSTQFKSALGSPQRPMMPDDCIKKFKDCAAYSIKPMFKSKVERLIELIKQLEKLENIKEIIHIIS
jgi:2-methylcitrate dehydratase PrpD